MLNIREDTDINPKNDVDHGENVEVISLEKHQAFLWNPENGGYGNHTDKLEDKGGIHEDFGKPAGSDDNNCN